jgi:hypothetical protein
VAWNREHFPSGYEIRKGSRFHESTSRVVHGPFCRVLAAKLISGRSTTPRIAHYGEKLQIPADLVCNIYVPIMERCTEGNAALEVKRSADGFTGVFWDMYEVKCRSALVKA